MRDQGGSGREQARGPDRDHSERQPQRQDRVGQRDDDEAQREERGADPHQLHFTEPVHELAQHHRAHQHADPTYVNEEDEDALLRDPEVDRQVERQHGRHRHEPEHAHRVDPDELRYLVARAAQHVEHHGADRALLRNVRTGRFLVLSVGVRLGQHAPREHDVHEAEPSGHESRRGGTEAERERSDGGTDHHACTRRSRQPPQRLGPVLGLGHVGNVGLEHSRGAAPEPLDGPREEQHPDLHGEAEHHERDGRGSESHDDGPAPPHAVRQPSPQRRRRELSNREARDHPPDHPLLRVEPQRVVRQQREDHGEPEHVHERRGHEHRQPSHRRVPTSIAPAEISISTTP